MKGPGWAVLFSLLLLTVPPSFGGLDIDFGTGVPIGEDSQLFFAMTANYFETDPSLVREYGRRHAAPDDLAVGFFISQQAKEPIEAVFSLRKEGMSWWDISVRLGVPEEVWFLPVTQPPGPPYGNAYGFWKKRQADPGYVMKLKDFDIRNLVAVRILHEYFEIPVEMAMDFRAQGKDLKALMTREYRGRHGDAKSQDEKQKRDHDWKTKQAEKQSGKGHDKKK